jgi:GNAT superfamily N-acetyltransferase
MRPTTRRARPDDAEALVPLLVAFNAGEQIAWNTRTGRPALDRLLASDDLGVVIVVEHDAALIGYAIVTWGFDLEFAGRDAMVTDVFVVPDHRQHRAGVALIDAVIATAHAGGAGAVHLAVDPANPAAVGLYRRAGFVQSHRVLMSHFR